MRYSTESGPLQGEFPFARELAHFSRSQKRRPERQYDLLRILNDLRDIFSNLGKFTFDQEDISVLEELFGEAFQIRDLFIDYPFEEDGLIIRNIAQWYLFVDAEMNIFDRSLPLEIRDESRLQTIRDKYLQLLFALRKETHLKKRGHFIGERINYKSNGT